MTPEEARELLDGATPGEWQWDETGNVAAVDGDGWEDVADYVPEEDAALIVAAPGMAAMIAGMREEWGVEVTHCHDGDLHTRWGYTDRKDAAAFAHYMGRDPRWNAARIVRRYVTDPEEA